MTAFADSLKTDLGYASKLSARILWSYMNDTSDHNHALFLECVLPSEVRSSKSHFTTAHNAAANLRAVAASSPPRAPARLDGSTAALPSAAGTTTTVPTRQLWQ